MGFDARTDARVLRATRAVERMTLNTPPPHQMQRRIIRQSTPAGGVDHPIIKLTNSSGFTWNRGWVAAPLSATDTSGRVHVYNGGAPNSAEIFAILLNDIADGETGDACVTGLRECEVNITDATHDYAKPQNGFFNALVSTASPAGRGTVYIEQRAQPSGNTVTCIVDLDQRGQSEDTHFVCLVLDASSPSWDASQEEGTPGDATVVLLTWDTGDSKYKPATSTTAAHWFGASIQIDSAKALWGIGHVDADGNHVLDEADCTGREFTHGLNV